MCFDMLRGKFVWRDKGPAGGIYIYKSKLCKPRTISADVLLLQDL